MKEKTSHLFVTYDIIQGEMGASGTALIPANEDHKQAIHQYFEDFYGEETEYNQAEVGRYYEHASGEQAIKITSWKPVSEEEYNVLKKFH